MIVRTEKTISYVTASDKTRSQNFFVMGKPAHVGSEVGSWLTSAKVLCAWLCIDKKDSIFQMKGAWSPIGSSHAHIL